MFLGQNFVQCKMWKFISYNYDGDLHTRIPHSTGFIQKKYGNKERSERSVMKVQMLFCKPENLYNSAHNITDQTIHSVDKTSLNVNYRLLFKAKCSRKLEFIKNVAKLLHKFSVVKPIGML